MVCESDIKPIFFKYQHQENKNHNNFLLFINRVSNKIEIIFFTRMYQINCSHLKKCTSVKFKVILKFQI